MYVFLYLPVADRLSVLCSSVCLVCQHQSYGALVGCHEALWLRGSGFKG
jgi:hypothetical protein